MANTRRFFKKPSPNVTIRIAAGEHLKFDTWDRITAYYSTDDERILTEIDNAIANHMGAITEISEAEYDRDFLSKKNNLSGSPKPLSPWREELVPNPLGDTTMPRMEQPKPKLESVAAAPVVVSQNTPQEPSVGKRRGRPRKN